MRIKSVLFSILGSLAAFAVSTEAFAAASGEFCGGIANVQCNADLHCVLDGSFPDAGGVCVPDYCGVWTGNVCPDGFSCDLFYPDFPDSNGVCVADDPCANGNICVIDGAGEGEFCGGIAGILCADGLDCELDGPGPDAGGTCVVAGAAQGEFCGGIGALQCAAGLECQLDSSNPDAGGVCVVAGAAVGEFCGGFGAVQCANDLVCQLDGNYPDAGGTCYRPASCEDRCGGAALQNACYCDAACVYYGDCCDDYSAQCG